MRVIAEIPEHWQAEGSICAISRSLDVCQATVRKYVYAAEAKDIGRETRRHHRVGNQNQTGLFTQWKWATLYLSLRDTYLFYILNIICSRFFCFAFQRA